MRKYISEVLVLWWLLPQGRGGDFHPSLFLNQYWQLDNIYLEGEINYLDFAGAAVGAHKLLSARELTSEHSAERRTPLSAIVTGYISISITIFHVRRRCSDIFVVLAYGHLLRLFDLLWPTLGQSSWAKRSRQKLIYCQIHRYRRLDNHLPRLPRSWRV